MLGHLLALEMAHVAVEESIRRGATFADARFEIHQREDITVRNGEVRRALIRVERGLGVRTLVNGAWGFASVSNPTRHDATVIARRAADVARAAAVVQERSVELAFEPPHAGVFRTPIQRDPLAVPLESKLALCFAIDEKARISPLVKQVESTFLAHRVRKLYVSSEGSELDQDLVHTGFGFSVGASDGQDFQVRSYPDAHGGLVSGRGWEAIESQPWAESAPKVAAEAIALLTADPCPAGKRALILAGNQMALQIHESCGHPTELDRVLGSERNFAGASFLVPERLGNYQYGSRHVTLYADAREAGGVGSFGFDDEGVEAQRVDLVTEGRFSGYLSSRESASRVGLKRSSGAMRANSYATLPLVRMTNVSLEPGTGGNLEALIADTKDGILMETNRSWSIDDLRYNFQFGCEAAWEIKDGKKGRLLKNPVYAGITPQFWGSMDAVCDKSEWALYGVTNCGKGQPMQALSVGHGTAPGRFQGVTMGSKASELHLEPAALPPVVSHPEAAAALPRRQKPKASTKKPKSGRKKPRT
ncbi:MAG: TldD/PmbA family protein [Myxococcota bacterium]